MLNKHIRYLTRTKQISEKEDRGDNLNPAALLGSTNTGGLPEFETT